MTLTKTIEKFLIDLELTRGRSQLTIENYGRYLAAFDQFAAKKRGKPIAVGQIDAELIEGFRLWLHRKRTKRGDALVATTRNYYLIALRSFLKYCQRHDIDALAPDKIELARHVKPQVQFLTLEQFEIMLKSPDLTKLAGLRDRAVLEVLFSTGLRVGELVKLDRRQVNVNTREFSIRGKGGKDRVVFLSETAAKTLSLYFEKRNDEFFPVFINHQAKPNPADKQGYSLRLTSRSIQRIIQKHAARAGIVEKITPHTLRHTFATDLLQNGADIRSVQEMLGHSSIQTTQIYTHVTNKHLREVHEKFHRGG